MTMLRFFICFIFFSNGLQAAKWSTSKSVNLSANLANNESTTYAFNIRPSLSIKGTGNKLSLNTTYSPSAGLTNGNKKITDINHFLGANLKSTLIDQFLFINANANASMVPINNNISSSNNTDNNHSNANLAQSFSFSLSPYIQQRLGTFARLNAKLNANMVINSGNVNQQSAAYNTKFNLSSGHYFKRFSWNLGSTYSQQSDVIRQELTGFLDYRYNRQWRFGVNSGYNTNNIESRGDTSGLYFGLRTSWNPSPRTSLSANYSKRGYGNNLNLNLTHSSRRSRLNLTYNTSLSDSRQEQLLLLFRPQFDENNNLILNEEGNIREEDITVASITSGEYFISNKVAFEYSLLGRRNQLNYSANATFRRFLVSESKEQNYLLSINWGHHFSQQIRSNVRLSTSLATRTSATQAPTEDRINWSLGIGGSMKPGPKTTFSINYNYRQQTGDAEFIENSLSVSFGVVF